MKKYNRCYAYEKNKDGKLKAVGLRIMEHTDKGLKEVSRLDFGQEKEQNDTYEALCSTLSITDFFETVSTYQIEYPGDLFNQMIKKCLPFEFKYGFNLDECSNDTSHKFYINKEPEKDYDIEEREELFKEMKNYKSDSEYHSDFDLYPDQVGMLLKPFADKGELPYGEYIINVCW